MTNYPVTYDEKEMPAYRAGRLYSQTSFVEAAKKSGNAELMKFVSDVLKVHGDINVEVA